MTKEELRQLHYLKEEQEMWEYELWQLKNQSMIKGQEITGMPMAAGGTSDKTGDYAIAIREKEEKIEQLRSRAAETEEKIISFIQTIEDSYMRQVINYRYIRQLSWNRIAKFIGIKGKDPGNVVMRSCYRFLDRENDNTKLSELSDRYML